MASTTTTGDPGSLARRRRTMNTAIGALVIVAGPEGLRAVLWPGEDGTRVSRAIGPSELPGASELLGPPELIGASELPGTPDSAYALADGSSGPADRAEAHLECAQAQLVEYFAGTRREFDLVLDPAGTDFQLRAWKALRAIPYGRTISYGQQAAQLGEPGAARAVGVANGRNPLSIVVPCHRVVGASGALTGFAGGLGTKAWLLAHERGVLEAG